MKNILLFFAIPFLFNLSCREQLTAEEIETLREGVIWEYNVPELRKMESKTFTESHEDIFNPERGFYAWGDIGNSFLYSPLNANSLRNFKSNYTPIMDEDQPAANYRLNCSLVYRVVLLNAFNSTPNLTRVFLRNLERDFEAARNAGVKLILRFAYSYDYDLGDNCKSVIEPTNMNIVIAHIQGLASTLQSNKDVVALYQFGFIGNYGENYYTSNNQFGCGKQPYTNLHWDNRSEVLRAFLDIVPKDRMVQVRVPQQKQKTIFTAQAPSSVSSTLTELVSNRFNRSDESRIGFYNDCFLGSYNDQGTFFNHDGNHTQTDANNLRNYMEYDSRFVVVGGETCEVNNSHDNCTNCGNGQATNELSRFHYSFLSSGWHPRVLNDWTTCNCMDEIKNKLGYRFVLKEMKYTSVSTPSRTLFFNFKLENIGYAAPYNYRPIELILKNETHEFYKIINLDARGFDSGTHEFSVKVCAPDTQIMPNGNYKVYLSFPDPAESLYGRKDYSIRLANSDIRFTNQGYNDMGVLVELIDKTSNLKSCLLKSDYLKIRN